MPGLWDGPTILLLGGRGWKVTHLDWSKRIAWVEQTGETGRSRWRGQGQFLSYDICQAIRRILTSDDEPANWSRRARSQMVEVRAEFTWLRGDSPRADSLRSSSPGKAPGLSFVTGENETRWWTFAGGRAKACLAHALETLVGGKVSSDNLSIRVNSTRPKSEPSSGLSLERAVEGLRTLPPEAFHPALDEKAMDGLKFSECLPVALARQVLCARFMDSEAVRRTLERAAGSGPESELK